MSTVTPTESAPKPVLSGIVVHWRNERQLGRLLSAWPADDRFPLCVVDNGGATAELETAHPHATWLRPQRNLGFGAGVNAGFNATAGHWRLFLNPDVSIDSTGLEQLGRAADRILQSDPNVALVAPRLLSPGPGSRVADQFGWQLRPLTRPRHLLAQCFFLARPRGPAVEPEDGSQVEQPAAGALLVRADAFEAVGGFDERFYPAWFEDVDLAHRLHDAGYSGRYARSAEVEHEGGASVSSLGFGPFLIAYYRNLRRFATARRWHLLALVAPLLVATTALCRIPLLAVRKPRAARSRRNAAAAFSRLAVAAISGWRLGVSSSLNTSDHPKANAS